MELCELTTSLKTRIEFIKQVGPRLVDPSAKTAEFTSMFRFAEEKTQVEQVLKSRNAALGITQLTNTRRASSILSSRGGRGAGGRGGGRSAEESPASSMANMFSAVADTAESESGTIEVDSTAESIAKVTL